MTRPAELNRSGLQRRLNVNAKQRGWNECGLLACAALLPFALPAAQPTVAWVRAEASTQQDYSDSAISVLDDDSLIVQAWAKSEEIPQGLGEPGNYIAKISKAGVLQKYVRPLPPSGINLATVTSVAVKNGQALFCGGEGQDGAYLTLLNNELQEIWSTNRSYFNGERNIGRSSSVAFGIPYGVIWAGLGINGEQESIATIDAAWNLRELDGLGEYSTSNNVRVDGDGRVYAAIENTSGCPNIPSEMLTSSVKIFDAASALLQKIDISHPYATWTGNHCENGAYLDTRRVFLDVSPRGDAYITIPLRGVGTFGGTALDAGPGRGVAVVKWSLSAGVAWVRYIRTFNSASVRQVHVDPTGGVVIGGMFGSDGLRGYESAPTPQPAVARLDCSGIHISGLGSSLNFGGVDSFLWKLSADGGSEWAATIGSADDRTEGLATEYGRFFDPSGERLFAVDRDGSIYITGFSMAQDEKFFVGSTQLAGVRWNYRFIAKLVQPPPPGPVFITLPPTSQIINAGEAALLSVEARGTDLKYEWFHNGTPVIGASTATLHLLPTKRSEGGEFKVRVSNTLGEVVSEPVTIQVRIPQILNAEPTESGVTLLFGDATGEPMTPEQAEYFELQTSSDLKSWTKAGTVPVLAGDKFEVKLTAPGGQYYRVMEP